MIRRELGFFIFNGLLAVAITYGVYRGLVAGGLGIRAANAIGYVTGMMYGFFANRSMAFRDASAISRGKVLRYVLLHLFTLVLNVSINAALLEAIRGARGDLTIAFLAAIAVSAATNFAGLKYWVFHRAVSARAGDGRPEAPAPGRMTPGSPHAGRG
jgi:putative flippase GtrA